MGFIWDSTRSRTPAPRIDAVVAEEDRTFARIQKGPAHKEFVRAFIEKREPRFNQP